MSKYSEKLTVDQRLDIIRLHSEGKSYKELGEQFGIHPRTVQKMVTGSQGKYRALARPAQPVPAATPTRLPAHPLATGGVRHAGAGVRPPAAGARPQQPPAPEQIAEFRDKILKMEADELISFADQVPISWFGWPPKSEQDKVDIFIPALKEALSKRRMTIRDFINSRIDWRIP